jgi:transcriptional regulator with XRE-family HTH domain
VTTRKKNESMIAGVMPSRTELGDFLRSRREKLAPAAAGLRDQRRRRTPGLRREEVAERAGISIDWYTRLEQGRTVSPSRTTIDALAKALRLSKAEHTHLRTLARSTGATAFSRETVPETMRRMVESLNVPAYITGRRWDLLAWNDAAVRILTDFKLIPEKERNIMLYMLTAPAAKRLFGKAWAEEAKRMIALFRTTYDVWAGDPAFIELIDRLRQGSPEFEHWWQSHDVSGNDGVRKLLHHSSKGLLSFATATFQANAEAHTLYAAWTCSRGEPSVTN